MMTSDRRPLIAGNWKMNTSLNEAIALANAIASAPVPSVDVVVCPPFPWLLPVKAAVAGSGVSLGAQNCWPKPSGAYTGEISPVMLKGVVSHVIVGHSERRQILGESDALIREKISAVLAEGLTPIVCVGETLETRQAGSANSFVSDQLLSALADRPRTEIGSCVVAYEPIWAIGTGVAASPADAESMSLMIKNVLDSIHPAISMVVRVLYGGSVTPANCVETLQQTNVDGALVGGASLKAESFLEIVRSVSR